MLRGRLARPYWVSVARYLVRCFLFLFYIFFFYVAVSLKMRRCFFVLFVCFFLPPFNVRRGASIANTIDYVLCLIC